jgi:pimeloyl-ACP methyl ester carboxylesterase
MPQGEIEKNISLFVKRQFPAIYREDGPELVQLVEEYYKWSETQENQHLYQSRRLFETKDIDSTLESMIILFKKKFLADLPLKADLIKFIVKNILDLYRAKGTARGIELFFAIFYQEFDIEIAYPSAKMQKISDSEWKQGVYLQMFPNNNLFTSKTGAEYEYYDLLARNIEGAVTKAKASVRSVNFFVLNGVKTPVIYLDGIQGTFRKYEDIITNINGEVVSFGKTNGSLSSFEVDSTDSNAATSRKVGEVFEVRQKNAYAGTAIVTKVSTDVSGEVQYELKDGGYGYTVANTRLIVSDQSIILNNGETGYDQQFIIGESISDALGNTGTIVGQNESVLGFKMVSGQTMQDLQIVTTATSGLTIDLSDVENQLTQLNATSPGLQFADTGSNSDVKVSSLTDTSVASVITDPISPYLQITMDAADYGAITPMSGTASPVLISTPLDEAFDIQDLTIGRIGAFENLNPGSNYKNDVFALPQDSVIKNLDRKNQKILFSDAGDAGSFSIGDRIRGVTSNVTGVIQDIDQSAGFITVVPFNYYGLNSDEDILLINSPANTFDVSLIEDDFEDYKRFGDNAIMQATTEFAVGKVEEVAIVNSGFGYVGYDPVLVNYDTLEFQQGKGQLRDADGNTIVEGFVQAETQGSTAGYWAGQNSHLSGFKQLSSSTVDVIVPTNGLALAALSMAFGLDPTTVVTGLSGGVEPWLLSTASDGFPIYDLNKQGLAFSSTTGTQLQLIKNGTASEAVQTRWTDIVVPSMKSQFWYPTQQNIAYSVSDIITTYEQEYIDSGMRIQDSNFYQEYSYQIKSTLPLQEYEKLLRENVHLAGSKLFGDFIFKAYSGGSIKQRFLRKFNDQGQGSPFDQADIENLRASITNYTADSTFVAADHIPGGTGGLTLVEGSAGDLTITRNWDQGFHDYEVTVGMPTVGTGPYPVAILLHGNGGTGEAMVESWADDLPGHILIGIQGFVNSWNVSMEVSNGPDIDMLVEMIAKLKVYNNVDDTKIRILGQSNGGALALRAAIEIRDLSVDVIACLISQTNTDQYRNSRFYYPSDESQTGDLYPNDGYDQFRNPIPQRRILQLNGIQDYTVPFIGGGSNIINNSPTFLSANDSSFRFAQATNYTGSQLTGGFVYGTNSRISDYGKVVWLRDQAGHEVTADMRRLINKYFENDFDTTY